MFDSENKAKMCPKSRDRTVGIVRDKLEEKIGHVSDVIVKLEEYVRVVSASSNDLQNISRLLSSAIETVMKTVLVTALERLRKASQEAVELLEEKRSVCEKLKEEGQQVCRCLGCVKKFRRVCTTIFDKHTA